MTKVNRHRTYGTTPEWRIIAKSLIEPGMGTGRPLLNCDLRKPVRLTRNGLIADLKRCCGLEGELIDRLGGIQGIQPNP